MADASWGKTTDLALEPPGPESGGEWDLPSRVDVVFPNAQVESGGKPGLDLRPDSVSPRSSPDQGRHDEERQQSEQHRQ